MIFTNIVEISVYHTRYISSNLFIVIKSFDTEIIQECLLMMIRLQTPKTRLKRLTVKTIEDLYSSSLTCRAIVSWDGIQKLLNNLLEQGAIINSYKIIIPKIKIPPFSK